MLRSASRALVVLLRAATGGLAGAQGFPSRSVCIVVPAPPGAATEAGTFPTFVAVSPAGSVVGVRVE